MDQEQEQEQAQAQEQEQETREDVEESVRDEGRDEAAVTIASIDSKLDQIIASIGELTAKVDGLPTFEGALEDGAVFHDTNPGADTTGALPTADLSDLDLSI